MIYDFTNPYFIGVLKHENLKNQENWVYLVKFVDYK